MLYLCPVWNGRGVLHMLQHIWSDYQGDNIVIVTMGCMQSPMLTMFHLQPSQTPHSRHSPFQRRFRPIIMRQHETSRLQ